MAQQLLVDRAEKCSRGTGKVELTDAMTAAA
jgi:hypothetical protein